MAVRAEVGWFSRHCRDICEGRAEAVFPPSQQLHKTPSIADALRELKTQAIIDGEICALDEKGFPRFEWLVNRGRQQGTLIYFVFDLLRFRDVDLRGEPLLKRKRLLEKLVSSNPRILYVDHMEREGLAMYAGALALGLEGVVAEDAKSPYVEGPLVTNHWLK